MRAMIGMLLALGGALALAVSAADAHDGRRAGFGGPPLASVFPAPRDPWKSWGAQPRLRSELPHRVGPPPGRHHHGAAGVAPAPVHVWIPGQWVSDGARWVWVPGHWAFAAP